MYLHVLCYLVVLLPLLHLQVLLEQFGRQGRGAHVVQHLAGGYLLQTSRVLLGLLLLLFEVLDSDYALHGFAGGQLQLFEHFRAADGVQQLDLALLAALHLLEDVNLE